MGNDAVHHLRHHGINASRHWRSSTIGLSLSNAVVDKSHPGIDCYHGQLRLVLSVTRLDRPSIPIGSDFKRRDPWP